jgi:hypothetical protein
MMVLKSNSKIISGMMHPFGQTEHSRITDTGAYIGKTSIYRTPVFLDNGLFINPHILVAGTSGSGKTFFLKSLLARSFGNTAENVLIIDWNGEYDELITYLGGSIYKLGKDSFVNAFELFPDKKKSALHITELISKKSSMDANERAELYSILLDQKDNANLDRVSKSLEGENRRLWTKLLEFLSAPIFSAETSFRIADIFSGAVSINLAYLANDGQREFIANAIIGLVVEHMHSSRPSIKCLSFVVLDEAWKLLSDSKELMQLFREGRKYGIGAVLATQLLTDIRKELLANSACIFVFRLQSEDDANVLAELNIIPSDSKDRLLDLELGSCYVRAAAKDKSDSCTAFISKVDGVSTRVYAIKVNNMQIVVTRDKLIREIEKLGLNIQERSRINMLVDSADRCFNLQGFISILFELGKDRIEIIKCLKGLGMDDISIIKALQASSAQVEIA